MLHTHTQVFKDQSLIYLHNFHNTKHHQFTCQALNKYMLKSREEVWFLNQWKHYDMLVRVWYWWHEKSQPYSWLIKLRAFEAFRELFLFHGTRFLLWIIKALTGSPLTALPTI